MLLERKYDILPHSPRTGLTQYLYSYSYNHRLLTQNKIPPSTKICMDTDVIRKLLDCINDSFQDGHLNVSDISSYILMNNTYDYMSLDEGMHYIYVLNKNNDGLTKKHAEKIYGRKCHKNESNSDLSIDWNSSKVSLTMPDTLGINNCNTQAFNEILNIFDLQAYIHIMEKEKMYFQHGVAYELLDNCCIKIQGECFIQLKPNLNFVHNNCIILIIKCKNK